LVLPVAMSSGLHMSVEHPGGQSQSADRAAHFKEKRLRVTVEPFDSLSKFK
jgi:hypothetical protein